MDIINNTWVVGIIGGIISGIIVYFITDKIFIKKQDKEYLHKVLSANHEIIYTLRPLIAQKHIPSIAIIESLIESIGRKYGILRKDLVSISALVDDLIREIIDNSFLDTQVKMEFSTKLVNLKNEVIREKKMLDHMRSSLPLTNRSIYESRGISTLLASVASMTALLGTLLVSKDSLKLDSLVKINDLGAIAGTSILLPISALIISFFFISITKPNNLDFITKLMKRTRNLENSKN